MGSHPTRRLGTLALVLLGGGCFGTIGDGPAPSASPLCTLPTADVPLRRLTRTEYNHTLRDLLGDDSNPADAWLPDPVAFGFDNNAKAQVISLQLAEQITATAEDVALRALDRLPELLPCAPGDTSDTCADAFIDDLARRAYRRPLDAEDRQRLHEVYAWGADTAGFDTGIRLVIETVLESPHFLYRVELGATADADLLPLTDHEIGSRLAYFLWATMPDAVLAAAADAGELHTAAQIRAQAERMLGDWRARDAVARFARQWGLADALGAVTKDPALHPEFTADVKPWIAEGTLRFVDYVTFFSERGDFAELYGADYVLANERTAPFWGVEGVTGDDYRVVPVDPVQRAGMLTDLSWLTVKAKYNQSHPVARGVFVREHFLCQTLPSPPDDLDIEIPELDPDLTTRERFAQHSSDPACQGCHVLIDGIGFGFEHYDAIGGWRDTENGKPIDATGNIVQAADLEGPFDGAVELAHEMTESAEAKSCFTKQWFRYALGRVEGAADACTVDEIAARWEAGGLRIRELLLAITESEAFRHRRPIVPEECEP